MERGHIFFLSASLPPRHVQVTSLMMARGETGANYHRVERKVLVVLLQLFGRHVRVANVVVVQQEVLARLVHPIEHLQRGAQIPLEQLVHQFKFTDNGSRLEAMGTKWKTSRGPIQSPYNSTSSVRSCLGFRTELAEGNLTIEKEKRKKKEEANLLTVGLEHAQLDALVELHLALLPRVAHVAVALVHGHHRLGQLTDAELELGVVPQVGVVRDPANRAPRVVSSSSTCYYSKEKND